MGGAFLTLSAFNSFFPTMVQGRGWICIALVVFASWRPGGRCSGHLLFAFFDAFQLRLQTVLRRRAVPDLPDDPLCPARSRRSPSWRGRARAPQALMQPYRRGETDYNCEEIQCST